MTEEGHAGLGLHPCRGQISGRPQCFHQDADSSLYSLISFSARRREDLSSLSPLKPIATIVFDMVAQQPLQKGAPNGVSAADVANGHHFDANLTSQVIGATGPKANPRLAAILPNLTKHLHDFMRESEITSQELMAAFDLVSNS